MSPQCKFTTILKRNNIWYADGEKEEIYLEQIQVDAKSFFKNSSLLISDNQSSYNEIQPVPELVNESLQWVLL